MRKGIIISAFAVLALLFITASATAAWLYFEYVSPEEAAAAENSYKLESELKTVKAQYSNAKDRITEAESTAEVMRQELQERKAEVSGLKEDVRKKKESIAQLEEQIRILLEEGRASDELQVVLTNQLAELRGEISEQEQRIAALDELIRQYENITTLNFGYQAKKISDLLMKLAEPNRPIHTVVTEETDEETGELRTVKTEKPADLAFYYQDLTTGYTLSYNSSDVMYSASLIKIPYVFSMLKEIAEFENRKLNFDAEGNPLYDSEGNSLFEGGHPNLDEEGNILYLPGEEKYNLSRIWTFDKESMTEIGSGVIKDYEDGIQMSYRELVQYALKYSDNVAFGQLRKMFGYTEYYAYARSLGIRGTSYGFMRLSAEDCGKFLKELYSFIEENETYGPFIRDIMLEANYPYLIPNNIPSVPCAHKYGWDNNAYHDMAIVYDEHPYILVIMTDLDEGTWNVNTYIGSVVKAVHSIHKTFYSAK